ncbi:hypothetical protein Q9L58_010005 [Maublancomyces gigas]|uniref:Uncharacterized protein n=1 Tax=Discina gigas TaxID=1032678 RepID=A0ABR3G5Q8_9PEZI
MAKLSKRKSQGPLAGKRSKIPKIPPAIPHYETREEIDLGDIDEQEDDDDYDDDGDEDEDDETENVDDGDDARLHRRGSAAAHRKPQLRKLLQKHRDMKETQHLHFQLTFVSSETSRPAKSGKQLKKRKQELAGSHDASATQRRLHDAADPHDTRNSHGAQDCRGTAAYTIVEKHLLTTARPATDNHIFFVDAFPDAVELGNLVCKVGVRLVRK